MSNNIKILTAENFDETVGAATPTLVDFWAEWCGPCRMLMPIVSEVADETVGATVGKVNVDEQEEIAVKYGISSIPTLLLFKNGEVVAKSVGGKSKAQIIEMIEKNK